MYKRSFVSIGVSFAAHTATKLLLFTKNIFSDPYNVTVASSKTKLKYAGDDYENFL